MGAQERIRELLTRQSYLIGGVIVLWVLLIVAFGTGIFGAALAAEIGAGLSLSVLFGLCAWMMWSSAARAHSLFRQEVSTVESRSLDFKRELKVCRDQEQRVRKELAVIFQEREQFAKELETSKSKWEDRVIRADAEVREAKDELDRLRREFESNAQSSQRDYEETQKKRRDAEVRAEEMARRVEELREKLGIRSDLLAVRDEDVRKLRESNERVSEAADSARRSVGKLQDDLETTSRRLRDSESDLKRARERLESASAKEKSLHDKVKSLEANQENQRKIAENTKEITELRQQLAVSKENEQSERSRNRTLEDENGSLVKQVREQERANETIRKSLEILQNNYDAQRADPVYDAGNHLAWTTNYFSENKVTLQFINDGARIHMKNVKTDPPLPVEWEIGKIIENGQASKIQLESDKPLPEEFKLFFEYSLHAKKLELTIRPQGSPNIVRQ